MEIIAMMNDKSKLNYKQKKRPYFSGKVKAGRQY
jgi:hypothetical protein